MAVIDFMANRAIWEGTASQLLEALTDKATERLIRSNKWPKAPSALSGALRRVSSQLRHSAIEVTFIRSKTGRTIRLERLAKSPSPASPASPTSTSTYKSGVMEGDGDDGGRVTLTETASPGSGSSQAQMRPSVTAMTAMTAFEEPVLNGHRSPYSQESLPS